MSPDLDLTTVVAAFAKEWGDGRRTPAERFLANRSLPANDSLLLLMLAVELASSRLAGEVVHVDELTARFPENRNVVRRALALTPRQLHAALSGDWDSVSEISPVEENSPTLDLSPENRVDTAIAHGDQETIPGTDGHAAAAPKSSQGEQATEVLAGADVDTTMDHARLAVDGRDTKGELETLDGAGAGGPPASAPFDRIGGYDILGILGEGGMGLVYRARQRRADRVVALKVIRNSQAGKGAIERFKAEAQAAARTDHDNMVTVYEVGEEGGQHYFSMKLVDGESLAEQVLRGPLPPTVAARYIADVSRAVQAAHDKGVLHRDIKPGNILIEQPANKALITDFGLAKLQLDDASTALMTQDGSVFGTPAYMPPEQSQDAAHVTATADVYSLGATLFHLVTGERPFHGASLAETLKQVNESPTPHAKRVNADVPLDLDTICHKAMEKEPRLRFQTAAELAEELERFLRDEPIQSRQITGLERTVRWCRRNKLLTSLGVLAGVLLVVLGTAGMLASRAREFRAAAELNGKIAAQRHAIDDLISPPTLDQDCIQAVMAALDEFDRLAPDQATAVRTRARSAFANLLTTAIRRRALPDEDQMQLALTSLRPLLGQEAASIEADYERRLQEWSELFRLEPENPSLLNIPVVSAQNGVRRDVGDKSYWRFEPTTIDCPPQGARMQAEFANWRAAKEVGLMLNAFDDPNDEQRNTLGYLFLLRGDARRKKTMGDAIKEESKCCLLVIRNGSVLRRFFVDLSKAPEDQSLRLRATRDGTRLEFLINDLPPFAHEELFGVAENEGKFGVAWGSNSVLVSLSGSHRQISEAAGDLQRADALFSEHQFEAALGLYELLMSSGGEETRNEASLKHGICLLRLKRPVDAEAAFEKLALSSDDRWSMLAVCQLWLLYLETDRFEEAAGLLTSVDTRFSIGELASGVPERTREAIVDHYRRAANTGGGYRQLLPTADRVEKLKLAIIVEDLLNSEQLSSDSARFDLMDAYWQGNQLDLAQQVCEELMALDNLTNVARENAMSQYSWIMTIRGEPQKALDVLNEQLFINEKEVRTAYLDLMIPAARLYAVLEDWDRCAKFASAYRGLCEKIKRDVDPALFLVQGLAMKNLGKPEEAERIWREGYDEARRQELHALLSSAIMGSLVDEVKPADVDRMVAEVTVGNKGSMAMSFMAKGLIPSEALYNVPRTMWRNRRGKPWAMRFALQQMTQEELVYVQVKLSGYDAWRYLIVGFDQPDQDLTDAQDEVIWQMLKDHHASYLTGETTELHVVHMAQTYKGILGLFGWGGLRGLPDVLRQPMAYCYAHHFHRLGRKKDAAMFMNTAAATKDPKLKRLVEEARRKLELPSAP